jgi:hypothetical protein
MVFKLTGKAGKQKIPSRPKEGEGVFQISWKILFHDMVQATIIDDDIKAARPKGESEDVPQHKLKATLEFLRAGKFPGSLNSQGLKIHPDRCIGGPGEQQGVAALPAPDVQDTAPRTFFAKGPEKLYDKAGGISRGPTVFPSPVGLFKKTFLIQIYTHELKGISRVY